MRNLLAALCLTLTIGIASAQTTDPAQAASLFKAGKMVDALPFYEALAKASPDNMDYQVKLTFCFGAAATVATDPTAALNMRIRAHEAARRAVVLGSIEPAIQMLAKIDPTQAPVEDSKSPARSIYLEAEKAFSRGDTQTALDDYKQAADLDPKMYEAPLYAGDMAVRLNDTAAAIRWYRRAIAIDPNRETAHRYMADMTLASAIKVHDTPDSFRGKILWEGAERDYETAIVCEPRNTLAWGGLKKWANARHANIQAPVIERPIQVQINSHDSSKETVTFAKNVTIAQPASVVQAWIAYAKVRQSYRNESFPRDYPLEKNYRHSLKEESTALNAAISSIKASHATPEAMGESLSNLVALSDAGMLDCWILINASNNDIAKDYESFRNNNGKLLHDYLDRFVIHLPPPSAAPATSAPAAVFQPR